FSNDNGGFRLRTFWRQLGDTLPSGLLGFAHAGLHLVYQIANALAGELTSGCGRLALRRSCNALTQDLVRCGLTLTQHAIGFWVNVAYSALQAHQATIAGTLRRRERRRGRLLQRLQRGIPVLNQRTNSATGALQGARLGEGSD